MFQRGRLREIQKKKVIEKNKEIELEKGDIPALLIAAFTVFVPIILLFVGGIALFIWLFTSYTH